MNKFVYFRFYYSFQHAQYGHLNSSYKKKKKKVLILIHTLPW